MGKALPENVLTNAKTGLRVGIGLLALLLIQFNVRGPANSPSSGAYNWLHTVSLTCDSWLDDLQHSV